MQGIETEIKKYLKERGWDRLHPSDIAKSISIEAAELLELFQWTSLDIEETKMDSEKMEYIKKELADVLIYALDMAVLLELDTERIILDKLELVKKKYPPKYIQKEVQDINDLADNPFLDTKKLAVPTQNS